MFIYGCSGKDPDKKELIFPLLMRNNCDLFSFNDSSFYLQRDREGSARIALWRELSLINCYTLEISFCGADIGKYEYMHFNLVNFYINNFQNIYNEVAQYFCNTLWDCFEPDSEKVKIVKEEIL